MTTPNDGGPALRTLVLFGAGVIAGSGAINLINGYAVAGSIGVVTGLFLLGERLAERGRGK